MKVKAKDISSWILLEQAENATDWGFPDDKGGVLWLEKDGRQSFAIPAVSGKVVPFICVLSLRRCKNQAEASAMPEPIHHLLREKEQSGEKIGVWCHFGGNINPVSLGGLWRKWPRLQSHCRNALDKVSALSEHPLPFSKGQNNLPCFSKFSRFKKEVKSGMGYVRASAMLQGFWQQVQDELDREQRIQFVVRAANFGVAACRFHDESEARWPSERIERDTMGAVEYFANTFESLGFEQLLGPSFSVRPVAEDDTDAYEDDPRTQLTNAANELQREVYGLLGLISPGTSRDLVRTALLSSRDALARFAGLWREVIRKLPLEPGQSGEPSSPDTPSTTASHA